MDLKTYLKAEFSVCGPLLRELMSFFAGEKEQSVLALTTSQLLCPTCHSQVVVATQDDSIVACCGHDPQHLTLKSQGKPLLIASLEWLLQNRLDISPDWRNPWIDPARWSSRLSKTDVETAGGVSYYLTVIAELKVHNHLWASHKRTSDFNQLSGDEKVFIESIGFLSKLFKRDVTDQLGRSTLFTSLQECSAAIAAHERSVAISRFSVWDKFAGELSDEYRQEVWSVLNKLKTG